MSSLFLKDTRFISRKNKKLKKCGGAYLSGLADFNKWMNVLNEVATPKVSVIVTAASGVIYNLGRLAQELRVVETIGVIVTGISGTSYNLGRQALTTTVLEVKQKFERMTGLLVDYLIPKIVKDEHEDVTLRDNDTLEQVRQYGVADQSESANVNEQNDNLELVVFILTPINMKKWMEDMGEPSLRIGSGYRGHGENQLDDPKGISIVPAHPNLVVVTCYHQVRVYNTCSVKLLGRWWEVNSQKGGRNGELQYPWGVVVTADSRHIIVSDSMGNRLQLLELIVSGNGDQQEARLTFVRSIGVGQLKYPRGLALRSVSGEETVLVAEYGAHQVSEWTLGGVKTRTIGTHELLKHPSDVTVLLPSGEIAIADSRNDRVSIFEVPESMHEANFMHAFGHHGKENGQFIRPCAIAAAYECVLVLDEGTNRLQSFKADGTHICTRPINDIHNFSSKGLEWNERNLGVLAIANGRGYNAQLFVGHDGEEDDE